MSCMWTPLGAISSLGLSQGGTLDAQRVTVVAKSAEQRFDHGPISQKLMPLVVVEVGGDEGGAAVVALLHELEEDVGLFGLEIEISHLVDDQQIESSELG